jgi:nucleotide-binding universal stress UspA family protein
MNASCGGLILRQSRSKWDYSTEEFYMRVLIAIDGSPFSKVVVDSVLSRVWSPDTEFRVVSVVEQILAPYTFASEAYLLDSFLEAQKQFIETTRDMVKDVVRQLRLQFPENSIDGVLREGDVNGLLLDECREWKADLVLLGSHGRKGLERLLLGSVAEKIAASAPCNVEIIRAKTACAQVGATGNL